MTAKGALREEARNFNFSKYCTTRVYNFKYTMQKLLVNYLEKRRMQLKFYSTTQFS